MTKHLSQDELQRHASACHEAAHAVVAYNVGFWVNDEGVEIDDRQYTGYRLREIDNTTWRRLNVALAGWIGEHLWYGKGNQLRTTADLEHFRRNLSIINLL
jgi:hypothetical protein